MKTTTFSARLKTLREAARLTQQQLADLAGLSRTHIGRLETNDGLPGWDTLQALAQALGVGLEKFSENPKESP